MFFVGCRWFLAKNFKSVIFVKKKQKSVNLTGFSDNLFKIIEMPFLLFQGKGVFFPH